MFTLDELRLAVIIAVLLLVPGWALLAASGLWRRWPLLVRWIVATGLGIAFYPVLFYWARLVLPGLQLGFNKLLVLLAALFAVAGWFLRDDWKKQFAFSPSEWAAIGIFGATLFTRLWAAHLYPLPAWSDSLHHTLLTQLTAANGQLPYTLEPYEPASLNMYHLGLYAITGSAQILSRLPAHTALLWVAQVLNGLCGLGIYLVLDARVGRKAALAGAAVAGLLSFQPAWYINWGRDTQVASQAILLIAWWVTWEALRAWAAPGSKPRLEIGALAAASALLTAGVFLLHFRVAAFYLPLVAFSAAWELYRAARRKAWKPALLGTAAAGGLSLALVMPALIAALGVYIAKATRSGLSAVIADSEYFNMPDNALFEIGLQPWLVALAVLAGLFLLLRRSKFGIGILAWVLVLWLEGNAYRLNIPLLAVTNYGAVVILYYLPASLLIGAAVEELFQLLPARHAQALQPAGLTLLLLAGLVGAQARIGGIENYRFFMTAADEAAMSWIRANTPPDAVFAINTYLWVSSNPHGVDGGFWIPYFTGRRTSTGTMLNGLGSAEYFAHMLALSRQVKTYESQAHPAAELCASGLSYAYLGAKGGNFTGSGLKAENLLGAAAVYDQDGVKILKLCP